MAVSVSSSSLASAFRLGFLLFLLAAIPVACLSLPIESILKKFLLWIQQDLGIWGPFVLASAYIPLSLLAVPASILTLGGGYLFGLPIGFVADSTGATLGATTAFLLGRTIGRSYVLSKLSDYPKFQAVAIAIERSGFKIVFLLRLVPLLPFNMVNYLLSVTPVGLGQYVVASWMGMMPSTLILVYAGTTLKGLSDVHHEWGEISTSHWVYMALGLASSAVLMACIARVAKTSLERELVENMDDSTLPTTQRSPTMLPISSESGQDLHQPLLA